MSEKFVCSVAWDGETDRHFIAVDGKGEATLVSSMIGLLNRGFYLSGSRIEAIELATSNGYKDIELYTIPCNTLIPKVRTEVIEHE